jgi:hypothetical protein
MNIYSTGLNKKVAAVVICIGIPVMGVIYDFIPSPVLLLLFCVSAMILTFFIYDRCQDAKARKAQPQTCSDIKSFEFNLGEGNFVLRRSDRFGLESPQARSIVQNGVWHIESGIKHDISDSAVTIINVPDDFTAQNAVIRLGTGNILIEGLAAYNFSVYVRSGSVQIQKIYTKNINIHCTSGNVEASAAVTGNVKINCGTGRADVTLKNSMDDFRVKALAVNGTVNIGERALSGSGRLDLNETAPYELDVRCDMGRVSVQFN